MKIIPIIAIHAIHAIQLFLAITMHSLWSIEKHIYNSSIPKIEKTSC